MAKGTYEDVLAQRTFPKLPEDPSSQDKINQAKAEISNKQNPVALAERYLSLRRLKAQIEAELSALNVRVSAYAQLLEESKDRHDPGWGQYGAKENALRLPNGERIRVQREPYGQVQDKEAFRVWCLANGYERQLHLHAKTMNSLVKERLLKGEPEPDGCTTWVKTTIFLDDPHKHKHTAADEDL